MHSDARKDLLRSKVDAFKNAVPKIPASLFYTEFTLDKDVCLLFVSLFQIDLPSQVYLKEGNKRHGRRTFRPSQKAALTG